MRHLFMDLTLFDEEGNENNQGGGNATYTYEQLNEIATSRATRAEQAALSNYLKAQGLTQDEVNTAIKNFKEQREASRPDVNKITQERDAALAEIQTMKNSATIEKMDVQPEFKEFVLDKISKMVTKNKDFAKAAEEFKKENPQYFVKRGGYKVSSTPGTGTENSQTANSSINDKIRKKFGY